MKNSLKILRNFGLPGARRFKEWCGFTGGQPDTLRKVVGKKKIDLMKKVKPEFVEGAVKAGGATGNWWKRSDSAGRVRQLLFQ